MNKYINKHKHEIIACRQKNTETNFFNLGSLVVYLAWWTDALTCLEVLAYCSKSIMAWINHVHTLPKKFNVINAFDNLPPSVIWFNHQLFQALFPKV